MMAGMKRNMALLTDRGIGQNVGGDEYEYNNIDRRKVGDMVAMMKMNMTIMIDRERQSDCSCD